MRSATIYYKNDIAGILTETNDGNYTFQYDSDYIKTHPKQFLTFTMPITDQKYISNKLFPFFEGLIPEGWLLEIASNNWKINRNDKMGLLLACCHNCIGAVSVLPINSDDND